MKTYIKPNFVKVITFNFAAAITLWPFGIFFKNEHGKRSFMNHEAIHWKQQKEMLGIFFYLWYLVEWLIRLPFGNAYYNISFEREAYRNEHNKNYLNERKPFAWIKYLWV